MTLPVFALWMDYYLPNLKNMSKSVIVAILCVLTIIVILIKYPYNQYTSMSWEQYCVSNLCSNNAAKFLISHHLNTDPHLLTDYDLGGWLIWNFPQIKPTIDGRMTIWIGRNGFNPLRQYEAYMNNSSDIDTSGYNLAFMSERQNPLMYRFLELANEKKWRIIYIDRNVVILKKAH